MPEQIHFDEYVFTTTTLTEYGVVTPTQYDIRETKNGVVATAKDCVLYGDLRRPFAGEMTLSIERTASNGITWHAEASMEHLIKGVKVKIDPIPGTKLMEPSGNPIWTSPPRCSMTTTSTIGAA